MSIASGLLGERQRDDRSERVAEKNEGRKDDVA